MQPFGRNRHGPKIGGGSVPFWAEGWVSIEHKVPSTEAYLHTKWRLDASSRLATIELGRKLREGAPPPFRRGLGPHLTHKVALAEANLHAKCHLDPSSCLATINMGRKLGGSARFWGGGLGPHLTQSPLGQCYLHVKFHIDPSNRLATVHQRYRQTYRQDTTDKTAVR